MSLKINVRHVENDDLELKGELPVEELDLDCPDELVHARQPLKYSLTAQKTGHDILVRGKLSLVLDCECSRCLKPFKQKLELEEWAALVPLEGDEKAPIKDDSVDLTPYLREDILLEFPQHPLCKADCAGLPNRADKIAKKTNGAGPAHGSPVWSELNKLKF
jgi:uncharacterized protein